MLNTIYEAYAYSRQLGCPAEELATKMHLTMCNRWQFEDRYVKEYVHGQFYDSGAGMRMVSASVDIPRLRHPVPVDWLAAAAAEKSNRLGYTGD